MKAVLMRIAGATAIGRGPWLLPLGGATENRTLCPRVDAPGHYCRTPAPHEGEPDMDRHDAPTGSAGPSAGVAAHAEGIVGVFLLSGEEVRKEKVDLASDPQKLIIQWMTVLDEQKRIDDAALASVPMVDEE